MNRGIVTKLSTEYFKKAKGTITAVSEVDPSSLKLPENTNQTEFEVYTDLLDSTQVGFSTLFNTLFSFLKQKQKQKSSFLFF